MDWRDVENPEKEREYLLKAIAQKPSAELYYKLATVYENVKDFKKALFYGNKAINIEPNNIEFNEFMAFVHGKNGDVPDAIKYWERVVAIDPEDSQFKIDLSTMKECLPFWIEQHKNSKIVNGDSMDKPLCDENYQDYLDTIQTASNLLNKNNEWINRFAEYAKGIKKNISRIKNKKDSFNQWSPLYLYMNVSQAKGDAIFNLRYLGQSVADIDVKSDGSVKSIKLDQNRYKKHNEDYFGFIHNYEDDKTIWEWSGKDATAAKAFRKHFCNNPQRIKVEQKKENHEHRIESMFLTEFSKRDAKDKRKELRNIQPVKIAKIARFQMPTPFSASNDLKYPKNGKGGGIDILARVGKGNSTKLCIMELKDENTAKEPPKVAIKQGLAYATFISKLLRSKSGKKWWNIFGFSGKVRKDLKLLVACVMPISEYKERNNESFKGIKIVHEGCTFELHYIYFKEEINKILEINTSLNS
ncbi:MAG: tetratricopeptide repeat protein [Elusimicrobia bacterium]|nr:tetratricopeptide repeat protein [Candidatus Liberimonas magnetica]